MRYIEKTSSISRRGLLRLGSALAALPLCHIPLAQALDRRAEVNIKTYYQGDWIAAFKQAFNEAAVVEIPAGLVVDKVNTGIFIPAGKTLKVSGGIKGNGRGRFVLQDGCKVLGANGGRMNNITLDVRGSDCEIRDLDISGSVPVTLIYIGGKQKRVMRNLLIDNITAHDANYAILRQGFHNQLNGVRITNSRFSRLQGDAIEWNVAINDKDILISDHVIEDINCTNGKINWGIGIGLAGSTYDNRYPENQTVKNFVVANITGRNCRQLVHVENGKHFIIRNITAHNITPEFSKSAEIDNATVAIYGCDNFVIDNVNMTNSAGMLIGYGTVKGKYLSIPQNFRINQVVLDNKALPYKIRGLQISAGNQTSFVALTNIRLRYASLELHNRPQHLFLRNVDVMQTAARGPALKMNFDLRNDVRGHFMAKKETLLSMGNINAVNEHGQSSVDVDYIGQQVVNMEKVNFSAPYRSKK